MLAMGHAGAAGWENLPPYEVTAATPIVFSPVESTLVLEDPDGSFTLEDVLQRQEQFKPASEMGGIDALKHYWILQKISSALPTDRNFRFEGSWKVIWTHVIRPDEPPQALKSAVLSRATKPRGLIYAAQW